MIAKIDNKCKNGLKAYTTKASAGMYIRKLYRYLYITYLLLILFTTGCSVSSKIVEDEENGASRKIDYTLYDLTYMEGIKQKMNGNLGEAIDKFEDAIEINPESDAANYQISQIAAMRRDYDNAIKYGMRAYNIDKKNTWYMMQMANVYIQLSKLDSAAIWLEKTVQVEPENENEKYRLGNIYVQTGQEEKAEKIFEDFYNKYPGSEQIFMALVNVKLRLNKYEETIELIGNELEKNPENTRLRGILAEVYGEIGKKEKAEMLYEEIMKGDEYDEELYFSYLDFMLNNKEYMKVIDKSKSKIQDEGMTKESKIGVIARIMQDSIVKNDYPDKIIEIGNLLFKNNEDDPTIILIMAEIYKETGNMGKEIETLTDYIEKDKRQYYVWEKLILRLNEINDIERLYKYSSEAARLFNTAPLPKILYAFALIEKEKFDEAGEELRKVRILVNNEEPYLMQILAMEAEIAYRKGDIKKASQQFDKALEIDPENTMILNNYAYYLAEEEVRLKDAQLMIEKCLKIEKNITYIDTYAWVLYKRGKYREAEKVMRSIFESGKINDAELIEHYGYINKAIGKCQEAIVLWQTALKIDEEKGYLIEEIRKCIERE